MTDPRNTVADIYAEYVRIRQSGNTIEKAVRALRASVGHLPVTEVNQLTVMVQQWENINGQYYKPSPHPSTTPTNPANPATVNRVNSANPREVAPTKGVIRPIKPNATPTTEAPKNGNHAGQAKLPASPSETPVSSSNAKLEVPCPNCGKMNRSGDHYCSACGQILPASRAGTKAFSNDEDERPGSVYFGPSSTLVLIIRGAPKSIEVQLNDEIVIGRSAPDSAMHPDVDLAPYDGENLGVSRLHASLKRQDDTVTVMDLNSRNHSYINGQRLHPREVRVLRDGDQIRLGKLPIKVVFKHATRRVE